MLLSFKLLGLVIYCSYSVCIINSFLSLLAQRVEVYVRICVAVNGCVFYKDQFDLVPIKEGVSQFYAIPWYLRYAVWKNIKCNKDSSAAHTECMQTWTSWCQALLLFLKYLK